jgi:L-2-hydroxyglutarate oxidase LhgO
MRTTEADFLIIGGGIVGLSIGNQILKLKPKSQVIIAEKEIDLGEHASGRNSGVLHAGFYYSPDSLKAKFCRQGNFELRQIISKHSIEIRETGKVVVAKNDEELIRLKKLFQRGVANGVKVELLPASELTNYEPLAKTYKEFLWSPTTAVSDPHAVLGAISKEFVSSGGVLLTNSEILIDKSQAVYLNGEKINPGIVINSAGVNALNIAHKFDIGLEYALLPVLGMYKTISDDQLPLKTLVYPVPDPRNPFLGVHFTLTTDNKVKIGPTAIPVIGREQYSGFRGIDFQDVAESIKAVRGLLRGSAGGLLKLATTEFPKISTSYLINCAKDLVPSVSNTGKWKKKQPGLRAQLVNKKSGEFEQDFVVRKSGKFVHILNAVSPGWTAAIPFANWIIETHIELD